MLIPDAVHVWRDAGGDYHLEWDTEQADQAVVVEPVLEVAHDVEHYPDRRAKVSGLPHGKRHYFRLRDEHGNEVVATERKLGMEGTPNFRDFGGYRNAAGQQVKWGYLYRSGQLSALTDRDLDLLGSLDLDVVFDFRRVEEQESDPSRMPAQGAPRISSLPIIPGSNSRFFEEAEQQGGGQLEFGREAMFAFMREINRDFVEGQQATYARMFHEILETEDARFLVHCAAGKDRTGFAAAMMLLALGVPRDVVMRDYMLTSRFFLPEREIERLKAKYDMAHMDSSAVRPMLEVHEDYLEMALLSIDEQFGSVETYLESALGVGNAEMAELRRRYLV
ncbi:tyrosine-protein phosphatase [Halioglobus maricola]|uniref:Tyrosine-protein phosphatase n=1 Tax=Halioglobus maricola TaxID=2601894 RepID=A0A5P9NM59_9GAMM|nr:tyrosine-protein phosphatase [Halioglobus maricola]QFU76953.1 tyrosine-protein phosphatase [Halioglobus maricola]